MKKIILLLLVLCMVVGLFAACAPQDATTAPTTVPSNPTEPTDPTEPADPWAEYETITVAEALAMNLADGEATTDRYYLIGTVAEMKNVLYGEMTLTDETGSIYVYGTYSVDGALKYSEMTEKAFEGDKVLLHCIISNYQGTIQVKNARLIDYIHVEEEFDESDYTSMTIAEAREASKGTKVKVTGVVARITFANGMVPSGVVLVDGTSSIYVYDSNVAGRVAIGNEITVLANKTYWILESESTNASKYGYNGCNQLDNATLVSNDEGNHDFDKSWITEATVKEIMDTPVTEDITTKIFKVTAQVKKVPGTGFTNYYFNDLDGVTGSYTYTQCNGNDFAWLDAFDGKICTVYLMAINAKSNPGGCVWRFLPVAVIDENFDVSTINVAEFAVKYHGVTQFLANYTGDPALELKTVVDSELLNFTGAELTFSSNNTNVVFFENGVMHCGATGTAVITVSCTYNGQTYSEQFEITVERNDSVEYISVTEAINANVGEVITVKGIVGPGLVNKVGFYLIDENGVIAITTSADNMAILEIGQEVILTGTRDKFHNNEGNHAGQTAITNCEITANYYGKHEYSTNGFAGTISVEDFYNLDVTVDYSTSVYIMTGYVVKEESAYYTNIYIGNMPTYDKNAGTYIRLYSSSASQYSWLNEFVGQEVTLEIAACNWNNKTYYTGCVLAVILEDGSKKLNTSNFN